MTANYELVVIMPAATTAKEAKTLLGSLTIKVGAKVVEEDVWGKKPLAYPIGKSNEGFYSRMLLEMEGDKVNKLVAAMKLEEKIMRHLLIKYEGEQEHGGKKSK